MMRGSAQFRFCGHGILCGLQSSLDCYLSTLGLMCSISQLDTKQLVTLSIFAYNRSSRVSFILD